MGLFGMIAILLGLAAFFQGILNRRIGDSWGLFSAIVLNTVVLSVTVLIFWLWERGHPSEFSESLRAKGSWTQMQWWYVLPGILGFVLVMGIPFAIPRLGATPVFLSIVTAQVVGSVVWDALFEGRPLSTARVVGALLVLGGSWMAAFSAAKSS